MENDQQHEDRFHKLQRWGKTVLLWGVIAAMLVLTISLLCRILFSSVQIGTPASETAALTRANERLLEMVKWTVSTILLVGGGLIGLNWYSNEQRYREDRRREAERVDSLVANASRQIEDVRSVAGRALATAMETQSSKATGTTEEQLDKAKAIIANSNMSLAEIVALVMQSPTMPLANKKSALQTLASYFSQIVDDMDHGQALKLMRDFADIAEIAHIQGLDQELDSLLAAIAKLAAQVRGNGKQP